MITTLPNPKITETKVHYEHRLIAPHCAGTYKGKEILWLQDEVLGCSEEPNWPQIKHGTMCGDTFFAIPREKIGIFMVTQVTLKIDQQIG